MSSRCEDGGEWDDLIVVTVGQDVCNTGCWADNGSLEGDGNGYNSGNPCNCNDIIDYRPNGNTWDIIVAGTQINVGFCEVSNAGAATCSGWDYACIDSPILFCHTYYCH